MKKLLLFFSVASLTIAAALLSQEIARSSQEGPLEAFDQLGAAGGPAGADLPSPESPADPREIAAAIIRAALGLIGIILFALIVYAGALWMTAGGNTEQIDKAKGLLRNSVIGLLIILSAYSITIAVANVARGYPVGQPHGVQCLFNPLC